MSFRIQESFAISIPKVEESNVVRVTEALLPAGGSAALEIKLAAIHEGLTRNKTFYTKEGLTHTNKDEQGHPGGLESWTSPVGAPIIKNHDSSNVDNIIGRVTKAEWVEKAGREPGHVELTASITDPEAIQKVIRGEYQTGSVGLDVESAHCNICGTDLQKEEFGGYFHEHQRGTYYKKGAKGSEFEGQWIKSEKTETGAKLAYIQVGNVYGREYSMVVTPSDAKSRIKSMEVKEMALVESGHETINLMPTFKESVKTPEVPIIKSEDIQELSVAELFNTFRGQVEADPLSTYFEFLNKIAMAKSNASNEIDIQVDGERNMLISEASKFAEYIRNINEDLEDEFEELLSTVLSTETLPDSAFALVKNIPESSEVYRMLPYKSAEGITNKTQLRTALSRWNQVIGFTEAEKARALRKLRAAAGKAGLGGSPALTNEEKADNLRIAMELVAESGFTILENSVANEADPKLLAKLETAEAEIATLRREAIDRDNEIDSLSDQITTLGQEIEEAQNGAKAVLADSIVTLLQLEDADKTSKIDELLKLDTAALEEMLAEKTGAHVDMYVSARLPRSGIGQSPEDEKTQAEEFTNQSGLLLAAHLGDKKAKLALSKLKFPQS